MQAVTFSSPPPSPSKSRLPAASPKKQASPKKPSTPVKVLNANGMDFNPAISPPRNVAKALDRAQARAWIESHPPIYRAALSELVDKIEYVRAETFGYVLHKSVIDFKSQIESQKNRSYTILIEPQKSNQWVAEVAYKYLAGDENLPPPTFGRLGIKDAQVFLKELSEKIPPSAKNVTGSVPNNIVLFDDGSYSGKQITDHVTAIFTEMKKICQPKDMPHVFVVIPFMTSFAKIRLLHAVTKLHCEQFLHVAKHNDIRTVSDLSEPAQARIKELYWPNETDGNQQHGLLYFAHKIPNSQSFPGPLAEGKVLLGKAVGAAAVHATFKVIPPIAPPYKAGQKSTAQKILNFNSLEEPKKS